MTRGVYIAATGMLADEAAQDAIAQNLANASTTGYKQDVPQFESFEQSLLRRLAPSGGAEVGALGRGAHLKALATDFTDGTLQKTDNPLDVALSGDAYLTVRTPAGVRLSRDGSLTRSPQGLLVQANGGAAVLGQDGQPIRLPAGAKDILISTRGDITADGKPAGRLRLAGLARFGQAVKVGDNEFTAPSLQPAGADAAVHQGYLETSNVSVVKEMVAMIAVQRAFETGQKMVQAEDDATDKAVNDVGKV